MRELWAIFKDDLEGVSCIQKIGDSQPELTRIDLIWHTPEWDGRRLHAMWIVDATNERSDVIRVYGSVPVTIAGRYAAYVERTGGN